MQGEVKPLESESSASTTSMGHPLVDVIQTADKIAASIPTDQPFTDPAEQSEILDQGLQQPVPTLEQRKFSAPEMEWDATR